MGPVNFFAQVCCLIVLNPVMFSRADKPPDISPEQKSKPDQQQSFDFIIGKLNMTFSKRNHNFPYASYASNFWFQPAAELPVAQLLAVSARVETSLCS